jgi:two-component system response regulator YesN
MAEAPMADGRIDFLRDLLDQRIQHEWTLEEMASCINLSSSHFKRLFKLHAGSPPGEYLSSLRLERAREMLADSGNFLRIKEICFRVGITSESRFSRDFKKRHNMSPTEYRAMCVKHNPRRPDPRP